MHMRTTLILDDDLVARARVAQAAYESSSQEQVDYRAIRSTHQAVQEIRRCLAGYEG